MHSVILKNDAVGDLVHSLSAINNITSSSENKKITIFLSKLSENFAFLVKKKNVEIKVLNYHLKFIEKIKLIFFLSITKVECVYIISPKSFYFLLPLIFWRIKFFAICVNNINNYKRPNIFLRKFLYKYMVNDREKIFRRDSTRKLQEELTKSEKGNTKFKLIINTEQTNELKKYLPKKYIYFHYKKKICEDLGWGLDELKILFNAFSKYNKNIIFTRDIDIYEIQRWKNGNKNLKINFEKEFNLYDFKSKKFTDNASNILLLDNIVGKDLVSVIKNADQIVSFHGIMTLLGFVLDKNVLDLWHLKINSWNDYRNYRNAFYEFKPKSTNYEFTIPKKDIYKTIDKIRFSLKKCQKN